jgi:hypothetical protein
MVLLWKVLVGYIDWCCRGEENECLEGGSAFM